jgi:hypothetical protein
MSGYLSLYSDGLQISIPGSAIFSLLHNVQTISGAHPASSPMGTGDRSIKLTTHLHLVLRSRIVEPYLPCPYVFVAEYFIKYKGRIVP